MASDLRQALDGSFAAVWRLWLEATRPSQDLEGPMWRALREHLGWVYEAEEAAKRLAPSKDSYFNRRDASDNGRALGGLIFVRGRAVHHQAAISDLTPGLGDRATKLPDGSFFAMKIPVHRYLWPPLQALPDGPAWTTARGQDRLYEEHVAGRKLVEPLREAMEFLHGEPI